MDGKVEINVGYYSPKISIFEWNGEEYNRLRKLHLEKKFSEISLCSVCTSFGTVRW